MGRGVDVPGPGATEQRVEVLLAIARDFGMGIPLEQLRWLMAGSEDPSTPGQVEQWLRDRPALAEVHEGVAFLPGHAHPPNPERRARAQHYERCALDLLSGPLAPAARWTRCVAITGSVAYGNPEEGDDLDFLVIAREGALWAFLAFTYLSVRLRAPRSSDRPSDWCFNHVLSEGAARSDYATSRGLLFAREALTARPLLGSGFYRELLGGAHWMRSELPRLYERCLEEFATDPRPSPQGRAPVLVRALNAMVFVPLASYLQVQGLLRNWRFRRSGRADEAFRTQTHFSKLAYVSDRFDRLMAAYARASARPPASAPT